MNQSGSEPLKGRETAADEQPESGDALVTGFAAGALWQLVEAAPSQPELTIVGRGSHPIGEGSLARAPDTSASFF
ncbi:MAG TPA: hypothetical protein VFP55_02825 [Solirubrobacteraceae bacterium]|nr:hypothetical protein [Solirubrobacteraceae bacterium]